ncbi:MAG TPA: hypothetical protein VHP33_31685 [Polyangiaceae bacterium]|nr:hypothetical protein [Polyangiaceae bacterium]
MRQALDFQRAALWLGWAFCALACGEKFTGVDSGAGGAAGSAGRASSGGDVSASGSAAGGEGAADGGMETGGKAAVGGGGRGGGGGVGVLGGTAGVTSIGGVAGSGGGVVEVPPVPLEGLELWFDATVGVTESNGVVAGWKDRSGNARHAAQTALNYRPKLVADGFNGKPTVVFDGEGRYLKLPTLPGDFTHGVSIFAIGQQEADDGTCMGLFEASNGPEVDDIHLGTWENALLYEVYADTLHPTDQPLLLGKPQLLAAVHQMNGGVQLRRNSNGVGESNMALPATIPRELVYLGSTEYATCKRYAGSLSEILVYSRGVDDSELVEIESYLQKKWDCCQE